MRWWMQRTMPSKKWVNVLPLHVTLVRISSILGVGGGGYFQKNLVGVCGMLPKTLTIFKTKICDFPYPIYDLTKTLIHAPYLRPEFPSSDQC